MRSLIVLTLVPMLATGACHASWEKDGKSGSDRAGEASSGARASRTYEAKGFTEVALAGPDDAEINNGAQFSVTAEGDPAALDQLDIRVEGGRLLIGRKQKFSFGHHDNGAKVHVTLPRLTSASLTGPGNMHIDKGEGNFHAALSGPGNLSIDALSGGDIDLSSTGPGDITVGGAGQRLKASIAGPGDIDASKFTAASANISVMGPGSLKGVVKGEASISIMGPGDVDLTGGAKCSVTAMGPGEAHCS